MNIPFHDFKKEYQSHKKKIDNAIQRVLKSGHYILGTEVLEFENNFAQYLGSQHVIGVANGMEALQIALMAQDIGPGDEVITTSLSAVATALAVKATGATVVFADIDEYGHLDPIDVENKITPKTKAIIPVHLYGQAVNVPQLVKIARKHNIVMIEDCAQAHGAMVGNKKVGTIGETGCFSFYPTKNLGGYGDSGAICTNNAILAEKMRMIRNYGQKNRYEHPIYGLNSRLDELQAAILGVKLKSLDKDNNHRRKLADRYLKNLADLKEINLLPRRKNTHHVFHLLVVETSRRDELMAYLKTKNIASLIHYPIAIHKQKLFAEHNALTLPQTEKKISQILSLPCHPHLSIKEVDYICKEIRKFFAVN